MSEKEHFLGRWSRVKREVAAGAVPPNTLPAAAPATPLPSLETLAAQGMDADFSAFMQTQVEESVRRVAIQQLFRQPVFNVMDGLDVYIDDYSVFEPLVASELPNLAHARDMLFPDVPLEEQVAAAATDATEATESTQEGKSA